MLKGSNGIYLNSKLKPETKSLEEKCGILNIWGYFSEKMVIANIKEFKF